MSGSVVIILAAQRSGTNALRSVLDTHPEISAEMGEIFEESPGAPLPNSRFFEFLAARVKEDPTWALPNRRKELFVDFLDRIPALTGKALNVIDVKYNSTHHLDGYWREPGEVPAFFDIIRDLRIPIVHLIRENMLKTIISELRAEVLNQYTAIHGDAVNRQPIYIAPHKVLHRIRRLDQSISVVRNLLSSYLKSIELTYEEVFNISDITTPGEIRPLNSECLERLAKFFGRDAAFDNRPQYQKLTDNRLEVAIENWTEVRSALLGTPFQRFTE